mgnify:FL=1|tara:strand:- start:7381 stop:7731 length:351 start_codon:yes stop_codon:yes gene_type:complete
MANEENLKPFEKGKSGNPNGRPKGAPNRSKTILDILSLEQKAVNPITKNEETLNQLQLIVLAMLKKARAGEVRAAQWLVDNGYGKLMENFEVNQTGENTGSLKDLIRAFRTEDQDS